MPRADPSHKRCAISPASSEEASNRVQLAPLRRAKPARPTLQPAPRGLGIGQDPATTMEGSRAQHGAACAATPTRDIQEAGSTHRCLQGRPADPLRSPILPAGRPFDAQGVSFVSVTQQFIPRPRWAADPQCAVVFASSNGRPPGNGSGQDSRLEEEGHVDGRQCAARLRRSGAHVGHQPCRGRTVRCIFAFIVRSVACAGSRSDRPPRLSTKRSTTASGTGARWQILLAGTHLQTGCRTRFTS